MRRLVSTTARTESLPRLWPSRRDRPRCSAQRPLPSMITATCRGRRVVSKTGAFKTATESHLHDLVFFDLELFVELFDVVLGEVLDLLLRLVQLVLGDLLVLLGRLQKIDGIPAMVTQRYPVLLRN